MIVSLLSDILYLIGFIVMSIIQSIVINGIYESFRGSPIKDDMSGRINYQGNILYMIAPKLFEKHKYKYWSKPIYTCVKCASSFWGGITYWPFIIYLFGLHWIEIPVFIANVFSLVYLNYFFYKRV